MSDSIASGCLVHYNNRHIQVRKDFFDLCAYDKSQFNQTLTKNGKKANDEPNQECMAKILRLLETLTDHEKTEWHLKAERLKAKGLKISAEPKEYRIELAYSTIARLLFGTYGESTIRKSIAVLLERNYIKRYQATKNSVPCYVLNIKVLQSALDKQAQESMSDPSQETEVSNLTSEDNNEVSNLTAIPSKLTPEIPSSNLEVSILTPNNIDKKETKTTKERRNDAHQQNSTVSTGQESSRSFIRSQNQSSLSSQQQSKPEEKQEVAFPPEAEQVYKIAEDLNIICLKRDEAHRDNCMFIASKGVTTPEQMKSLMQHCWQKSYLKDKDLNLKNLVNEAPGWLQLQRKTTSAPSADVVVSTMGKSTQALFDAEEERKKRILEKEATQGSRRPSLQELVAAQKKQRALERTQQC